MSILGRDHYQGQKWDLLGEIEALKRRIEALERSGLGLFLAGTTTLVAPGSILGGSTAQPPDGRALFRAYGEHGGFMVWEQAEVDATASTAIGIGDESVAYRLFFRSVTSEVTGGGSNVAAAILVPGGNIDIYDDGVDVCNLAVSATGVVTVARTAGADTFKVISIMLWQ
jgi:hypothetical protein